MNDISAINELFRERKFELVRMGVGQDAAHDQALAEIAEILDPPIDPEALGAELIGHEAELIRGLPEPDNGSAQKARDKKRRPAGLDRRYLRDQKGLPALYLDWVNGHREIACDSLIAHFYGCSDKAVQACRYRLKLSGYRFESLGQAKGWAITPPNGSGSKPISDEVSTRDLLKKLLERL